jgi:hypothetical protein
MISQETKDRIDHLFKTIETMNDDQFTEKELNLLISYESQFKRKSWLSDLQIDILEDIVRRGKQR